MAVGVAPALCTTYCSDEPCVASFVEPSSCCGITECSASMEQGVRSRGSHRRDRRRSMLMTSVVSASLALLATGRTASCLCEWTSSWRGMPTAPQRSANTARRPAVARYGRRGRGRKQESKEQATEMWRVQRGQPPPEVEHLVSADFVRHIRDGGPLAFSRGGDIPEIDAAWIDATPEGTARNVVNALCRHRFGEGVSVDQVIAGPKNSRGQEYSVTLALSDRAIFGSCLSNQVRDFDKDTELMLEGLRDLGGWTQPVYKLKVQTPGTDQELVIPDELWKCDLFPCRIEWKDGKAQRNEYLNRVRNTTNTFKYAICVENYGKRGYLTKEQQEMRVTISYQDMTRVRLHVDKKTQKRLQAAKQAIRVAREQLGLENFTDEVVNVENVSAADAAVMAAAQELLKSQADDVARERKDSLALRGALEATEEVEDEVEEEDDAALDESFDNEAEEDDFDFDEDDSEEEEGEEEDQLLDGKAKADVDVRHAEA